MLTIGFLQHAHFSLRAWRYPPDESLSSGISIRENNNCTIHWIEICPVDNAIQLWSNRGLINRPYLRPAIFARASSRADGIKALSRLSSQNDTAIIDLQNLQFKFRQVSRHYCFLWGHIYSHYCIQKNNNDHLIPAKICHYRLPRQKNRSSFSIV